MGNETKNEKKVRIYRNMNVQPGIHITSSTRPILPRVGLAAQSFNETAQEA